LAIGPCSLAPTRSPGFPDGNRAMVAMQPRWPARHAAAYAWRARRRRRPSAGSSIEHVSGERIRHAMRRRAIGCAAPRVLEDSFKMAVFLRIPRAKDRYFGAP
jgi:hypothetical protein